MTYKDLNKDNIELIKELYEDYIERFKESFYSDKELLDFMTFAELRLIKCPVCGEYEDCLNMTKARYDDIEICEDCWNNGN